MQRRAIVFGLIPGTLSAALLTTRAWSQRPSRPIYRPIRPGRPERPFRPGQFYPESGGVNYSPGAGVFTVSSVNTRENTLTLRDDNGRTGDAFVSPRIFDVSTLKSGDVVEIDFFVPGDNDARIEVASIYPLELVPQ